MTDIFSASCSVDLSSFGKLYQEKKRSFLPKRFESQWPEPGFIGLCISPYSSIPGLAQGPDDHGRYLTERPNVKDALVQSCVPFIAKRDFVPFYVDVIPSSSWGASLANLLTLKHWQAFRTMSARMAGHVCQMCGSHSGPLECHEIWRFHDEEKTSDGWYRQSLEGFLTLCKQCHAMFHPGRAEIMGKSEEVRQRRCVINEWSNADYDRAMSLCFDLFHRRSQKQWVLDLSKFQNQGPVKIMKKWVPTDDGTLYCEEKDVSTRLIGMEYSL